ncbi:MAG: alanine racemase [Acidobacteriaceae bacterium]
MTTHTRPIWAEVSKARLIQNYRLLQHAAGPDCTVLGVVKANAYGHGSPECAPLLAEAGAEWLGVTSVDEGIEVREACSRAGHAPQILVMCGVWQGEAAAVIEQNLTPVVWESYHLDLLEAEARQRGLAAQSLPVHLEIDSGMSRQGVAPDARLTELLRRFTLDSPLRLDGVLTHFASAEVVDAPQNAAQIMKFEQGLQVVKAQGLQPRWVHAGNSSSVDAGVAARLLHALAARVGARAMTRPGLALYGYSLLLESSAVPTSYSGLVHDALQPVLTWKTRLVSLRSIAAGDTVGYSASFTATQPMRLALLPIGYADGLRRELSNRGEVLLHGQRAPMVGRVSMDLTIVDVTAIPEATIGDEAVVIGEQQGLRVTAEDHARIASTIPYEILCAISDRVPRLVVE